MFSIPLYCKENTIRLYTLHIKTLKMKDLNQWIKNSMHETQLQFQRYYRFNTRYSNE